MGSPVEANNGLRLRVEYTSTHVKKYGQLHCEGVFLDEPNFGMVYALSSALSRQ